jgi:hypothetical protein
MTVFLSRPLLPNLARLCWQTSTWGCHVEEESLSNTEATAPLEHVFSELVNSRVP